MKKDLWESGDSTKIPANRCIIFCFKKKSNYGRAEEQLCSIKVVNIV